MRLTQVLVNLIKNSIKFCTKGSQLVVLSAFNYHSSIMTVAVIDTGRGIDAKENKKLFHLFGKLESTADVNVEGSGMGLVICKKLINVNHGEIEIDSEGNGLGCTVRFTMRMTIPEPAEIQNMIDNMSENSENRELF